MQIASETDFSRWVLMPSRSVLCLVVKFCIVELMVAGEVMPRVNVGGLGLGGKKSSGSMLEGFTVSDIFTPATEKNLLNSSEISLGLLEEEPFITMVSIFLLEDGDFVASFSSSHVFRGLFSYAFKLDSK